MRTVRLMTCNDAFQAQIISGALENEGIPSVLHNVNTSYVLRGAISQIAGVDIFVYEADYNRALEILERNEMIPEQLKYCPRCHSDDIRFVLKKRHRLRAPSGHGALGICMPELWSAFRPPRVPPQQRVK